jgi:hypothetical protein
MNKYFRAKISSHSKRSESLEALLSPVYNHKFNYIKIPIPPAHFDILSKPVMPNYGQSLQENWNPVVKHNFPCHYVNFPWHSITRKADVTTWANSITNTLSLTLRKRRTLPYLKAVCWDIFFQIIISIILEKTVLGSIDFPSSFNHECLCHQFCCHIQGVPGWMCQNSGGCSLH